MQKKFNCFHYAKKNLSVFIMQKNFSVFSLCKKKFKCFHYAKKKLSVFIMQKKSKCFHYAKNSQPLKDCQIS